MFHKDEGFCIRCGECRDGRPTAAQRETQAGIGRTLLVIGILTILSSVAVVQIRLNGYPGNIWIRSWYDVAYDAGGKQILRGDDYVSWAQAGGGVMCGIGVLALLISRLNGRKRRHRGASATNN